jgi:CheY-like chemotaxis protein
MSSEICDHVAAIENRVKRAPKVLVVDDDPLTQCVLRHYLERVGYQMVGADNGREAIRLARQEMPQLVILDVMMPEIDGWTVLKQLKKMEVTKAIPVILLSGNADLMAREESLRSGATQLLVKPISPDQLLAVIRKLVPVGSKNSMQRG